MNFNFLAVFKADSIYTVSNRPIPGLFEKYRICLVNNDNNFKVRKPKKIFFK